MIIVISRWRRLRMIMWGMRRGICLDRVVGLGTMLGEEKGCKYFDSNCTLCIVKAKCSCSCSLLYISVSPQDNWKQHPRA